MKGLTKKNIAILAAGILIITTIAVLAQGENYATTVVFNETSIPKNDDVRLNVTLARDDNLTDNVSASFLKPGGTYINVTLSRLNNITTADLESGTIQATPLGGTATLTRYNFTDSVNNKGYFNLDAGAQPPTFATIMAMTTAVGSSCYSNLTSSDNVRCRVVSTTAGDAPTLKFNFKINESVELINYVFATVEFQSTNNAGVGEDCSADLVNWTASGTIAMGADSTAEVTREDNRTAITAIRDVINTTDNNLTLVVSGNALDAGESCDVDYVMVIAEWNDVTNQNSSATTYSDVSSTAMTNITMINITVTVSANSSFASVNKSNAIPDLFLEVWNGTGWMNVSSFNFNTTDPMGTKNISIINETVLTAWETTTNRDIRIKGINLDNTSRYDNYLKDEINWTVVTVELISDLYWTYVWTDTSVSGTYNVTQVRVKDVAGNINVTNWNDKSFEVLGDTCTPTNDAQWDLNCADSCVITGLNRNVTNWIINNSGTITFTHTNLSYQNFTWNPPTSGTCALNRGGESTFTRRSGNPP